MTEAYRDVGAALERASRLEAENADLREEMATLRAGTTTDRELARELAGANGVIKELQKDLAKAERAVEDTAALKLQVERLRLENKAHDEEIGTLRQERKRATELSEEVIALKARNAVLDARVDELKTSLRVARDEEAKTRRDLIELRNRIADQENERQATADLPPASEPSADEPAAAAVERLRAQRDVLLREVHRLRGERSKSWFSRLFGTLSRRDDSS